MKTNFVLLTALCYMAVGLHSVTLAAPPGPCFEDRQKYCNDIKPGAGRIFECLEEHENQLSAACKDHIDKMAKKFERFTEACSGDLAKYCGQVKPGQGRGVACLKGNEDRLSAACRSALPRNEDAE